MKAIVTNSNSCSGPYYEYPDRDTCNTYFVYRKPEIQQDILVIGENREFDIRMRSTDGFYLPMGDGFNIDVEIKFTVTPKPQSPTIKTFK